MSPPRISRRRTVRHAQILSLGLLAVTACGGGDSKGPLDEVDAIVFIQRQSRMEGLGDIFQYSSYIAGAKLMKLSPPTADGELTVLCCDQEADYAGVDIIVFDVAFDAKTIVFSAKLTEDQHYGLFLLHLENGDIEPGIVRPVSGRPDNRFDLSGSEIHAKRWHALDIGGSEAV